MEKKAANDAMVARIRALLNRTTENGCTQAEAEAAAKLAGKLLDRYGLDPDTVRNATSSDMVMAMFDGLRSDDPLHIMLEAVERYCGVKSFLRTRRNKETPTFFGLPADVEVAIHLLTVIEAALRQEGRAYLAALSDECPNERRRKVRDFRLGMCEALHSKLMEMTEERNRNRPTGTGLVVLKEGKVNQAFNEKIGPLRKSRALRGASHAGALMQGRRAADRVRLLTGVQP